MGATAVIGERLIVDGFDEGGEPWRIENAVSDEPQPAEQIAAKAKVTPTRVKSHCRYWIKNGLFYTEGPPGYFRYLRTGEQPKDRQRPSQQAMARDEAWSINADSVQSEQTEKQAVETSSTLPERVMRSVTAMYDDLAKLYSELAPQMEEGAIGARILISPPLVAADVMFIAYQPGDTPGFPQERGCDSTWPNENEYATRGWNLAKAVRQLVYPEVLQARTVVANVVFWRANTKEAWQKVPEGPRKRAEVFSLNSVRSLIKLLQPRAIFAIGFDAFKALVPTNGTTVEWRQGKGRGGRLVCEGQIEGQPVVGVPHLSGCMPAISRAEREVIARYVKKLFAT
jgi:hypothetical protein